MSQASFGEFFNPLWSLALEEQFYVLWPWLAIFLPNAALPWVIGAMFLTGPLSRFVIAATGISDLAIWISTPAVFDALGSGVCLPTYGESQFWLIGSREWR
jgi:peptidoglycan/LPS O-acetylase OafA/YrhL